MPTESVYELNSEDVVNWKILSKMCTLNLNLCCFPTGDTGRDMTLTLNDFPLSGNSGLSVCVSLMIDIQSLLMKWPPGGSVWHNMTLLCILLYTIMQQTFPTFLERMRAGLVPEEEILAEFKFQSVLYSVYIFWDLSPHFFHVPLRRAYKSTSEAFYVTGNDGFWL